MVIVARAPFCFVIEHVATTRFARAPRYLSLLLNHIAVTLRTLSRDGGCDIVATERAYISATRALASRARMDAAGGTR